VVHEGRWRRLGKRVEERGMISGGDFKVGIWKIPLPFEFFCRLAERR
jgi:hypothetical protein